MQLVGGKFEILRTLGAGGMGSVYLARDNATGTEVALKMLHPQYSMKPMFVARFDREADLALRVRHPNVCMGLEKGQEQGVPFFTMEQISGSSIAEMIAEQGCIFEPRDALSILAQAAAGLAALVAIPGVVAHRDLSAANIFVDELGRVKIADYGIAKLEAGNETGTGSFLGNVLYMSPEQINDSKRVDVRSDIYTLGVVFYEMLCGSRPFDGSPTEIANKHLYSMPAEISIAGQYSDVCQEMLAKTLAKNPHDRFKSPQDLIAHISAHVTDVRPVVPRKRARLRGPLIATAGAMTAVALLVAIVMQLGGPKAVDTQTTQRIDSIDSTRTAAIDPSTSTRNDSVLAATVTVGTAASSAPLPLTFRVTGIDPSAKYLKVRIAGAADALAPIDGQTEFVFKVSPIYNDEYHVALLTLKADQKTAVQFADSQIAFTVRGRPRASGTSTSRVTSSGSANTAVTYIPKN